MYHIFVYFPIVIASAAVERHHAGISNAKCLPTTGSCNLIQRSDRGVTANVEVEEAPDDFDERQVSYEAVSDLRSNLSENASVLVGEDVIPANKELLLMPLMEQTPAMMVFVESESDMLNTLKFCHSHGLRAVLAATGHDYNGRSSGRNAVRIATPKLCWVDASPEAKEAKVGAGCTWGQILKELQPLGFQAVTGAVGSVSISGSLQGGGHGLISRQYGLIADQLLSARVALANGSHVVVADAHGPHSDLYRALRGGGGGTYGAVVEFTIQIHPSPKLIWTLTYSYPLEDAGGARPAFELHERFLHNATWWAALPRTWAGWHSCHASADYETGDFGICSGKLHFSGSDPSESCAGGWESHCPAAVAEFLEFNRTYQGMSLYSTEWPERIRIISEPSFTWASGGYVRQLISNSFVTLDDLRTKGQSLTDLVLGTTLEASKAGLPLIWYYNDVLGGVIPEKDFYGNKTAISNGFRQAVFEVGPNTAWLDDGEDKVMSQYCEHTANELYALGLGLNQSYYNEVTRWKHPKTGSMAHPIDDWQDRFWGKEKFEFLSNVDEAYDPCNLLWVDRGVGSEKPKMTC